MIGQMTIWELIGRKEPEDPVRRVAYAAGPYWTHSWGALEKTLETHPDAKTWAEAVRHEFSPYGHVGHYSDGFEYELKTTKIYIRINGKETTCSWSKFAEEIRRRIVRGETERMNRRIQP